MAKQAELHWIGRAQFKNGFILHRISSGEKTYNVTIARGKVTSCCETNGESCKGFTYGRKSNERTCRHAEYALAREQELAAVKEAERVVREEPRMPTYHEVAASGRPVPVEALEEMRVAALYHGSSKRAAELKAEIEARNASPVAAKVQEAASIRDAIGIGDRGHLNGGPKAFSVLA